jgi:hypothetical protein
MLQHIRDAGQSVEVDIGEAARRLGTTPAALRKRIRRGTLSARKSGGVWRVTLPAGQWPGRDAGTARAEDTGLDAGSPPGRPPGQDGASDSPLTAALRDEIQFLRRELERKDMIIAAFAGRLPELPAAPVVAQDGPAPRRRWWQRLIWGPA